MSFSCLHTAKLWHTRCFRGDPHALLFFPSAESEMSLVTQAANQLYKSEFSLFHTRSCSWRCRSQVLQNQVSYPCRSCGLLLLRALSCLEKGWWGLDLFLHLKQGEEARTGTLSGRHRKIWKSIWNIVNRWWEPQCLTFPGCMWEIFGTSWDRQYVFSAIWRSNLQEAVSVAGLDTSPWIGRVVGLWES